MQDAGRRRLLPISTSLSLDSSQKLGINAIQKQTIWTSKKGAENRAMGTC